MTQLSTGLRATLEPTGRSTGPSISPMTRPTKHGCRTSTKITRVSQFLRSGLFRPETTYVSAGHLVILLLALDSGVTSQQTRRSLEFLMQGLRFWLQPH